MRLQKVELFGFKSFAEKTKLKFEPGITAIVGPNGCGKSNIADGIRWALGEQSSKLLRGARMEDVIFAGSRSRKPLGLAEVSLTFIENRGDLPTDFEEVVVTRRLYRSGESEYLLNGAPCRLRDITDLFLDTGLGAAQYALIEQGSIGAVVNAKPQDRRALIEEAAGIMTYKTRKRAALNKLEATDQNLLRIRDIIHEVERQRNALKRQANKAERYRALEARLTSLRLFLKFCEHRQLLEELRLVEDEEVPLRETLLRLEAQRQAAEAALEALRARALDAEREVSAAQASLFTTRDALNRVEAELAVARRERGELGERAAAARAEAEALRSRADELRGGAEAARTERAAADQAAVAAGTAVAGHADRLATLETEVDRLREALDQARGRHRQALAGAAEHRNALATLAERERLLRLQADRFRRQQEEAGRQREAVGRDAESRGVRAATLDARRQELAAELASLGARLEAARAEDEALALRVRAAAEDVERQRGRLDSLKELEANFAGYAEGNRFLLQLMRAGHADLTGLLGPLSERLEVSPRHERALEALLGEALEAIRVASPQAAASALALLEAEGKGPAVLLLPSNGRNGQPLAAAALPRVPAGLQDGIEGPALDLVRFADGDRPLVERLLGDGLVVSDLGAALALTAVLAPPFAIATLAGEVITHRMTLLGGPRGAGGLLGRHREIREAEAALGLREAELRRLEASRDEAAARVLALERERETAAGAQRALEDERLDAGQGLAQARAEGERLGRQLELFGYELEGVEADLRELGRALDPTREALEVEEAAGVAAAAEETRTATTLSDRQAAQQALARELTEAQVAQAAAHARLEAAGREAERLAADEEAARHGAGQRAREAEALTAREAEAGQRIRDLEADAGRLSVEEAERAARLVACQEDRQGVQDAIGREEEALRGRRTEEAAVRDRLGVLGARRAETSRARALLETGLREEHGVEVSALEAQFAGSSEDPGAAREEMDALRQKLADLGPTNLAALEEYQALCQRLDFLTTQAADLEVSVGQLRRAIGEINRTISHLFESTLGRVNDHFDRFWKRLFGGGRALLELVPPAEGEEEPGVELRVSIPGKRAVNLSLLSGGERALTALALLLALFAVRPSPFCLLDEVDAPLDDANIERFVALLGEMATTCQFIVITHNKRTMEVAHLLYGITMAEEGLSTLISVRIPQAA